MEFVLRTRHQVWELVTWAGPLHSRIPEFLRYLLGSQGLEPSGRTAPPWCTLNPWRW